MNLDNQKIYKKLDKGQVGESIDSLTLQIKNILNLKNNFKLPKNYKEIKNIVLVGMGGSNLAGHILSSLFKNNLKVPFLISADYSLPSFVDKNTLLLASSYSGSTEEVLSAYEKAKKQKAKIVIIAANQKGKLQTKAKKDNKPMFLFNTEYNPCGQPRLGTGYSLMSLLKILQTAKLIKINKTEFEEALIWMNKINKKNSPKINYKNNPAKKTAKDLLNKVPILIGADFLQGNLHTLRNQLNETSKLYSSYLYLPDLNHYAMEGLLNPKDNYKYLTFVFFSSSLYSYKINKRMELTKKVVQKNNIKIIDYKLKGKTQISQSFELLQFGAWLSYYLAMEYNLNPVEIPFVNWFKKKLK